MLVSFSKIGLIIFASVMVMSCASMNNNSEPSTPIENPFAEGAWSNKNNDNITFKTRRGEKAVEVEVANQQGDGYVIPMNPDYATEKRIEGVDYTYVDHKPTLGDREIVSTFKSTTNTQDEMKKTQIEQSLGLQETDELPNTDQSYLARLDVVKQLFKSNRYEASLMEIDGMVKNYPTDAKLYEMRGTILDRMGYHDLALRSWKQSLEFKPNQLALQKIITKRDQDRKVASEMEKK